MRKYLIILISMLLLMGAGYAIRTYVGLQTLRVIDVPDDETRARLNHNFSFLEGMTDSSRIIFNYRDSTITILRYVDFDLEDGWSMEEGRTGWNDDDKTLEVGLDAGSVLQIGQEIHVRTLNNSGDTIPDGKAIYISGAQGSRPTIAMANNNSDTAYSVIGISTQEILDGRVGYSTIVGLVRGLNTAAWPEGTILWLDSIDGGLTATRPIAPRIAIVMGVVIRSNENDGIIGVKVTSVQRLAWQSDVKAQGAQTHWDILYWNNDSLRWELNDGVFVVDSVVTRVLDYEPPHGALAFSDSTATLDLTQDIWQKVTNGNNDLYTIIDDDGVSMAGDSMTITTPGDYMMWVGMSFNGNVQDVYHCAIYLNGVVTPFEMHRKTANNDTGNMSLSALLDDLAIDDNISLWIRNTGNNNDPVFISSQITILMIHPR